MAINITNHFELYKLESGEPSGINRKVWNGELLEHQRKLLNLAAEERDHKKRFTYLLESAKISIIVNDELTKANFYKNEFDKICDFLETNNLLSVCDSQDTALDNKGKEHKYTIAHKRSLIKSIPLIRALL